MGASSASPTNLVITGGALSYGGAPVAVNRGFTVNATNSTIDAEANFTMSGQVAALDNLSQNGSAFVKTGPAQLALTGSFDNEFSVNYVAGINVVAGTLVLDGSAGNQTNHTPNQLWVGSTVETGASLILTNTTMHVGDWLGLGRINGGINNTSSLSLYNSALTLGNMSLGWDGGLPNNLSSQFLTLNNSTLTNFGNNNLAEGVGSTFTMSLNSNSVFSVQNPLYICLASDTTGMVEVADSGQIIENNGWIDIAEGGSSIGTLILKNNSSLNGVGDFNVTDTGTAANGTVIVQDNATLHANNLWVGKAPNSIATLTITNNATVLSSNGLTMATYFDGTPEVTTANVYLSGGSLAVNLVQGNIVSGTPYGVFNFNGGTLIARNPFAPNFMFNLASINVLAGGAVIDSSNSIIAITQPLLDGGTGGGLTKLGAGTLYLNGVNTYTGRSTVTAGALGGIGTIAGPVTVASGAALTVTNGAGATTGTLTINNTLNLSAGSATFLKLGSAINDQIAGLTGVTYGGALVVTNTTGAPLVGGSVYQLFASASAGVGNFSSVTLLPYGAATFHPATGQLTITAIPVVSSTTISGGNLIVQGAGGTPGGTYSVLTSTNVTTPFPAWTTNVTGIFGGTGTFSNGIPINTSEPARFFRVKTP